jgi:hypothetical protein
VVTEIGILFKPGIEMEFAKRYEGLSVNSIKGMDGGLILYKDGGLFCRIGIFLGNQNNFHIRNW